MTVDEKVKISYAAILKENPFVELQERHLMEYERVFFDVKDVQGISGVLRKAVPNIESANEAGWFVKKPDTDNMTMLERKMLADAINTEYMRHVSYDPSG